MISEDSVPRLALGCRFGIGQGKTDLLLFPEGALRMNQSSRQIVQRCDGKRSIAEIVADLQRSFPSEDVDRLQQDVLQLLSRMHAKGVIEI